MYLFFFEYDTVLVLIVCVCNCVYKRLIRNTSYTVFTVLYIVEHFAQKYTLYDVFVLESGSSCVCWYFILGKIVGNTTAFADSEEKTARSVQGMSEIFWSDYIK